MSALRCRGVAPEAQRAESFSRLRAFLGRDVLRYSPFYRARFAELGLHATDIASEADWAAKVPFTSKDELRDHAADFVLQPNYPGRPADPRTEAIDAASLAQYARQATRMAEEAGDIEPPTSLEERTHRAFLHDWQPILYTRTGGTTGNAAQSVYTLSDLHGPFKRCALFHHNMVGWSPEQRFMSLLPAGEHLGFYGNLLVPILNGQPLRAMMGGRTVSTENQVLVAAKDGTQALYGTSSYLVNWLETAVALQAEGKIAGLPALQLLSASAEALSEGYAASIRTALRQLGAPGARLVQGMSSTELKSGGFRECDEGMGLHVDPQHYFIEIIDPDTKLPAKPGERGVLVWSHIDWHGTVILRYWSGDTIDGGTRFDECPGCGLTVPRLFPPFRRLLADFIKVKGARVDLAELRAAIENGFPRDSYQIDIRGDEHGKLTVRGHLLEGLDADRFRSLVFGAVELRLDSVEACTPEQMNHRLYGAGGWKPRWLINEQAP